MLSNFPNPTGITDTVRWSVTPTGAFNTSIIWNHLRIHHPLVPWSKVVWFPGGIPKHSFILWLAVQFRLSTQDRIFKFTPGPLACVLCHSQLETHDHLFFACPYSTFVWQELMARCGLTWNRHNWSNTLLWMAQHLSGKKIHHVILKMCLGAAVYGLWKERNNRTFKHSYCPKELTLQILISQIKAHISVKWKHHSDLDTFLRRWV